GCFQYTVIPFGLKNYSAIFSKVVVATFKEFIHKFLDIYFDDWTVFRLVKRHIASLCLMLDTCRKYQISLNLNKCIFCVLYG
ncbi:reverse transcriptase domain-containing protein, partial [Actinobacillus pleuropneumoniae]|uniref:reverse transcriptase domain-containing protein n=1 Tax=Actinobacillus pleuropneumoniae TaxID=715 RepID=UPI0034DD08F9